MTIREKVARAIDDTMRYPRAPNALATAAITAFLAAAAEDGWHMRPDEATEEMTKKTRKKLACQLPSNQPEPLDRPWSVTSALIVSKVYEDMLATAPEFEWDK